MRILLCLLLLLPVAASADWPAELGREGECRVCVVRGGGHGTETYVDWRTHEGTAYGFCSESCATAFDEMPGGYAIPVLPRPAPDFRWTALNGSVLRPAGDGPLLVDFWATWCAPCLEAMPELERLSRDFADDGLRVVGVSIDEKLDDLERFLRRRPVGYAVVHDGGEDPAWWKFRVPAIPAAFLLDGEGAIVAQWSGRIDTVEVRSAIEALLESD
jgi:thiol-disulfide isomerase/thioredoxin